MTQSEAGKGPGSRESQYAGKPKENFDKGYDRIHGERCIKHCSQILPCPICAGWTPYGTGAPASPIHWKKFNKKWYWKELTGLWKCEGCGDLVPETYKACPHCKTAREEK